MAASTMYGAMPGRALGDVGGSGCVAVGLAWVRGAMCGFTEWITLGPMSCLSDTRGG